MDGCELCLYKRTGGVCGYNTKNARLSKPELGEECPNFDYDCDICRDQGFRHYDCPGCDLTEEDYYGEE